MITTLRDYRFLIFCFATAILAALFVKNIEMGIGLVIAIFFTLLVSKRVFISVALISLLTLVSNLGVAFRTMVQLASIGSLIFLFIQDYGFNVQKFKKVHPLIISYLILLFFTMIIAGIFSNYPGAGIFLIARTIIFFSIAYLVYSQIREDKDVRSILMTTLIAAAILSLSVIVEFVASGSELINLVTHSYSRSSGLMSNVNAIGGIISNMVPITLAFLFYPKLNLTKKTLAAIMFLLIVLGVLLTSSRASFVSVFISILIVIFFLRPNLLKWFFLTAVFAVLVFLFYPPLNEVILLLLRVEGGLSGREVFWDLALNIIRDNPWLGLGPGAYQYEIYKYFPVMLGSWRGQTIMHVMEMTGGTNASHNMYLLFFVDMGLLGLVTALILPVIFYKIGFPVLKYYRNHNTLNYFIAVAIFAMGIGAFIRCLFMEMGIINYGYITTDLPFWLNFGILAHWYHKEVTIKKSN